MIDVLGCGALNLDLFYEVADLEGLRSLGFDLVPGGEKVGTPDEARRLLSHLRRAGRLRASGGGGSAANATWILSRMGWRTAFLGGVGSDAEGAAVLESMSGVDCTGVRRRGRSPLCIVVLDAGRRDRALYLVPGDDWPVPDLSPETPPARLLHLSSLVPEAGRRFQERLLRDRPPAGWVSFDPGEVYARLGAAVMEPWLRRTHLLFVTEQEAAMLAGGGGRAAASTLLGMLAPAEAPPGFPLPAVVLKRGRAGAAFVSREAALEVPAVPVREVVDNTGAGDAFAAGVLHGLLSGWSAAAALEEGARLAARSLAGYGRSWLGAAGA
ncbi:hypothetical protein G3N55_05755 [Dissulfurirhabdus thermomarina]|uniref:Carbohydrate kinase PfkB domain-containing protein n=1 Tax=Dissulfurirhabdus thermomarina TaxID=1765737 RepID=A0A6N9TV13_DISTH|nr:PfkB family carbohydrate kinase [Dissulfurirhabdus thermomarina]NDY42346.1 hypothetical protein [Dissulfurirhabdus thermomarina]NMX24218.1 hypothetical protein [Dissulfurirhabdus thermomarina]